MVGSSGHLARVRWQCRRGMLELDQLLLGFFDASYQQMSSDDKRTFERLLECNDNELFLWLMGRSTPEDPDLGKMVLAIAQLSFPRKRESRK